MRTFDARFADLDARFAIDLGADGDRGSARLTVALDPAAGAIAAAIAAVSLLATAREAPPEAW